MKEDIKALFESDLKGIIFVMLAVHEQVALISSSYSEKQLYSYIYIYIYIYIYMPKIEVYLNWVMYISDNFNSMCKKNSLYTCITNNKYMYTYI